MSVADQPNARIGVLGPHRPQVHEEAWVAPGAVLVGRVRIGARSSIWYGCVLRADDEDVVVGEEVNIQDLSCLHSDPGEPAVLEERASVGHRAIVHGARIGAGSLIGMGAVVLGGADIGAGSLVAAGAVVRPGTVVAPGMLVAGVPAKVLRPLKGVEQGMLEHTWASYLGRTEVHRNAEWD
ncbi:MAG: gamma carbonic anhydrase family protein [Streptosporangiales bacterium]|nr:gamma carbonic anhydrase family protein [Streptosporangiales bacterium]